MKQLKIFNWKYLSIKKKCVKNSHKEAKTSIKAKLKKNPHTSKLHL